MNGVGQGIRRFWEEEDGLGTLEILLILAVLVIIAIAFRKWIMQWVKSLFDSADAQIKDQSGKIKSDADTISP
ncbi:Flp1 family type IVb pilin [Paenibacillus sp. RC67]|uniref:Flp1 family type IVb pilin n=1 Tax=Paenibacillus sp. RC67 TaxID=3039392 RepID=UPI0024ADD72E|nr:Flp1 family type IVb pilin [Paenibacillus sp. RC67]